MKSHILPNRVFWRLDLATRLSCEFKPRANGQASLGLLSCSEQMARRFSFWHAWHMCFNLAACSREIQSRVPASLHTFEQFFTLSHTLPLHDSHLNTGFLISKYKQIWHGIEPTRWLIQFNLTISPFDYSVTKP